MNHRSPRRTNRCYFRRLAFEQIEDRTLLAASLSAEASLSAVHDHDVARSSSAATARFRIEATDVSGEPLSELAASESFLLNVYVSDKRNDPQGVFSAYLDLHFDSALVERTGAAIFDGRYSNAVRDGGSLPGLLDEVGGFSNSLQPLGKGEFLLVTIPFRAMSAGNVSFVAEPADLLPHSLVLLYGSYSAVDSQSIEYGSTGFEVVEPPALSSRSTVPPLIESNRAEARGATALRPNPVSAVAPGLLDYLTPLVPAWMVDELRWLASERVDRGDMFHDIPQGNDPYRGDAPTAARDRVFGEPTSTFFTREAIRTEPFSTPADHGIELPIVGNQARTLSSIVSAPYDARAVDGHRFSYVRHFVAWPQSSPVVSDQHWLRLGFLRARWGDDAVARDSSASHPVGQVAMLDLAAIAYEVLDEPTDETLRLLEESDDERLAAIQDLVSEEVEIDGTHGVAMAFDLETSRLEHRAPPTDDNQQPAPEHLPSDSTAPRTSVERRGPTDETTPAA